MSGDTVKLPLNLVIAALEAENKRLQEQRDSLRTALSDLRRDYLRVEAELLAMKERWLRLRQR